MKVPVLKKALLNAANFSPLDLASLSSNRPRIRPSFLEMAS